jgi:tetratricopeptide (TPR) repeat protein
MDSSFATVAAAISDSLVDTNYWPAVAARHLAAGKYSVVAELCREHLTESPDLLSGRLLYARALYEANQIESASEQFYQALALDPANSVALKYLGDIAYQAGDEFAAFAYYARILELDPDCQGIKSDLKPRPEQTTRTISLVRHEKTEAPIAVPLRTIPFITETMGDLYLQQGHPRLAAEVFRTLHEQAPRPSLLEKLKQAEEKAREKEKRITEHATIPNQ